LAGFVQVGWSSFILGQSCFSLSNGLACPAFWSVVFFLVLAKSKGAVKFGQVGGGVFGLQSSLAFSQCA